MEGVNISFLIYKAKWIKLIHCLRKQKGNLQYLCAHWEQEQCRSLESRNLIWGNQLPSVSLLLWALSLLSLNRDFLGGKMWRSWSSIGTPSVQQHLSFVTFSSFAVFVILYHVFWILYSVLCRTGLTFMSGIFIPLCIITLFSKSTFVSYFLLTSSTIPVYKGYAQASRIF